MDFQICMNTFTNARGPPSCSHALFLPFFHTEWKYQASQSNRHHPLFPCPLRVVINWLVVWNIFSIQLGRIIPIDFHIFGRGRYTTKQIISFATQVTRQSRHRRQEMRKKATSRHLNLTPRQGGKMVPKYEMTIISKNDCYKNSHLRIMYMVASILYVHIRIYIYI